MISSCKKENKENPSKVELNVLKTQSIDPENLEEFLENDSIPINVRDSIVTSDYNYFYDDENDSKLWIISLQSGFNGWYNSKVVTVKNSDGTSLFYLSYDYDEDYYKEMNSYTGITSIFYDLQKEEHSIFFKDDIIYGTAPLAPEVNALMGPPPQDPPFQVSWCYVLEALCNHFNNPISGSTIGYLMRSPPEGAGGGGSNGPAHVVTKLNERLTLNSSQNTWLNQNLQRAYQIFYYLVNSSHADKDEIAMDHLNGMINNSNYLNFVLNHEATGTGSKVWWEDNEWLSNPNNINFDLDRPGNNIYGLTAAEILLIKRYPFAASLMNTNKDIAMAQTLSQMGANGLNEKSDAFRHAFFNALNTITVGIGPTITQLFADAHESEVPSVLNLEKQMDLFNNNVGISIGNSVSGWITINNLGNMVKSYVLNGNLKYITPLNILLSPKYDNNGDKVQDCTTCLNGILNNSVLTWTNL